MCSCYSSSLLDLKDGNFGLNKFHMAYKSVMHIYSLPNICLFVLGLQRFVDVIEYVDYKNMSISM